MKHLPNFQQNMFLHLLLILSQNSLSILETLLLISFSGALSENKKRS